jgi:hypothetical protein
VSYGEIAAGACAFASSGFILGRVLANKMDINYAGLQNTNVGFFVTIISGLLGLVLMLVIAGD